MDINDENSDRINKIINSPDTIWRTSVLINPDPDDKDQEWFDLSNLKSSLNKIRCKHCNGCTKLIKQ